MRFKTARQHLIHSGTPATCVCTAARSLLQNAQDTGRWINTPGGELQLCLWERQVGAGSVPAGCVATTPLATATASRCTPLWRRGNAVALLHTRHALPSAPVRRRWRRAASTRSCVSDRADTCTEVLTLIVPNR